MGNLDPEISTCLSQNSPVFDSFSRRGWFGLVWLLQLKLLLCAEMPDAHFCSTSCQCWALGWSARRQVSVKTWALQARNGTLSVFLGQTLLACLASPSSLHKKHTFFLGKKRMWTNEVYLKAEHCKKRNYSNWYLIPRRYIFYFWCHTCLSSGLITQLAFLSMGEAPHTSLGIRLASTGNWQLMWQKHVKMSNDKQHSEKAPNSMPIWFHFVCM